MKRRRSLIYLAGAVWTSYLAGKCSPAWPTPNADSSIKNSAAWGFLLISWSSCLPLVSDTTRSLAVEKFSLAEPFHLALFG